MGRASKLARFADNSVRYNTIEPGKEKFETIKGKWNAEHFQEEKPLVVELACGRGEYTVGLGRTNPDKNHIGVDIKGARIWVGATMAIDEGLENVAFLRTEILHIEKFFAKGEIDELWITFPDPRPKDRDEKRRLTHPRFLEMYKNMVDADGWVKFKTDNTPLFEYTLEVLKERSDILDLTYTFDLYQEEELMKEHYGIKTYYEKLFTEKGEDIKYLKFRFDQSVTTSS
ncbi:MULTISPECIES: tRNA (guanosine(46)-N7)-methyltransferase TrmB [Persicobacter]|uniref:tRNA (guanine-N(7)-)-methyltransferase n=1 Tax=Persicobacter diffluens TaxID=981 RepID=A0AAN5AJE9_9BACT|nr:tRNA (guanosine(46)-N7)-methyltransferase TrmB [Persicobacter sp. CCB-QB2]GJM60924.1 tRNA (guanine-N(7)-)-methyltransferase [Persicobacter diffluens]